MSSFSTFKNNLIRDALLVPILDCLTGFYAGFAIFTVLGYMYLTKCVDSFADVAAQGIFYFTCKTKIEKIKRERFFLRS